MLYSFIITIFLVVLLWHFNRRFSLRYRLTVAIFGTQRERNQKHCYDFPSENNGWKKIGNAPVYGDKDTNCVFDPFVMVENDRFVMIVSERLNHGIDRLESDDGIHWNKTATILSRVPDTWQSIVNRATLVFHNGLWHMWYTGQFNNSACIGHTVSKDGILFHNAKHPCLKAEMKAEGVSVMNPCVLWNEQKECFQMWYAAGENYEPDMLFYAESKDGDHWVKRTEPVLEKHTSHLWECAKVGGCDVKIKSDGSYEMYYIGYQNIDVARICYATSKDGIHWNRDDNNLLIAPSKDGFDSDACYKPAMIERDGRKYMWYNGRHNNEEYIGLAMK